MAIVKVDDKFATPTISVALDGSTALSANSIVYRDTSNKVGKAATSSAGTVNNVLGVAPAAVASGATSAEVIPFVGGPLQKWEVNCTNNTASTQLWINHVLTDSTTVNNTTTHSVDPKAIFVATEIVGAASDKKLRGYFCVDHGVSA